MKILKHKDGNSQNHEVSNLEVVNVPLHPETAVCLRCGKQLPSGKKRYCSKFCRESVKQLVKPVWKGRKKLTFEKAPNVIKKAKLEEVSLMKDGTVEVGISHVEYGLFPGEAKAIATVCKLGEQYGYGNLIYHLREAWSLMLQRKYGFFPEDGDLAAGHVCVWCRTDSRTGKKVKNQSPKKS